MSSGNKSNDMEVMFHKLIASAEDSFSAAEKEEVVNYVKVGEYGLALQTFSDIVLEENRTISKESFDLISALSVAMTMPKMEVNLDEIGGHVSDD